MRRPWTWWLAWGGWLLTVALYGLAIAIIAFVFLGLAWLFRRLGRR